MESVQTYLLGGNETTCFELSPSVSPHIYWFMLQLSNLVLDRKIVWLLVC